MKILLGLIVLISLVESYTLYQAINQREYEWIHYIYMPMEYGIFALVFSYWHDNIRVKKILLWSIPIFAFICLVNALEQPQLTRTNSFIASLACSLYVPITAYTLYRIQKGKAGILLKDPRFWVSSALLLYAAGALSYFAFL